MEITNQTLAIAFCVAIALVATAAVLTIGVPVSGGEAVAVTVEASPQVRPVVARSGARPVHNAGPVRIAAKGERRAMSARLECGAYKTERPLSGMQAEFPQVPNNDCTVLLSGTAVPYGPVFPGDRLICETQDDRTACAGGVAQQRAGRVSVSSDVPGRLSIDAQPIGTVPVRDHRITVGTHDIRLDLDDGRPLTWKLIVEPDEAVEMHFPAPPPPANPFPAERDDVKVAQTPTDNP